MLLTPLIRRQLKVFAVLAFCALVFTSVTYADLGRSMGVSGYTVFADFEDPSGLYPRANVTYRGVTVGRVGDLELIDDGVRVALELEGDSEIPKDVEVVLHSTSAIGEQYVDLVPADDKGSRLEDGDIVPPSQTKAMPQIAPVLEKLNNLLKSVPAAATSRVLGQVDRGLGGKGPELADVVDESSSLLSEAQSEIAATTQLVEALDPVLGTQAALGEESQAYLSDLALLTDQLVASDEDLTGLLNTAPGSLDDLTAFVDEIGPTLPDLLTNGNDVARPVHDYRANLEHALVTYPALVARVQSALNPRSAFGDVKLDLTGNLNDPGSCSVGYPSAAQRRSPADLSVRRVDGEAHCKIAASGPESVRGARNLPCPNSERRSATPAGCGLTYATGTGGSSEARASITEMVVDGKTQAGGRSLPLIPLIRPSKGDLPWLALITELLGG